MTVASGLAEIRNSRKLVLVGTDPFAWEILSSDGTYKHRIEYDTDREDVACITCEANYRSNRCWARARVIADLERRFGKPAPKVAAPTREPKRAQPMSWKEVMAEARGERT